MGTISIELVHGYFLFLLMGLGLAVMLGICLLVNRAAEIATTLPRPLISAKKNHRTLAFHVDEGQSFSYLINACCRFSDNQ